MIHVAKINGMVSAGNPNGSNNVFNPKWIKTVKTIPSFVKYAFIVDLKVTPKLLKQSLLKLNCSRTSPH